MEPILSDIKEAIVNGDAGRAAELTRAALRGLVKPGSVLERGAVAGINEAGRLWNENQYFLPDVILSAEAFKAAMAVLEPQLGKGRAGKGKFLIAVVEGDMHDLGKSIVTAFLAGAGFEVVDLGVDVPTAAIIAKVKELRPAFLGLGAYMSTTMLTIKEVLRGLEEAGLRDKVKVLVGGAPTTQGFADEAGADAWGKDALDALSKVEALIRTRRGRQEGSDT